MKKLTREFVLKTVKNNALESVTITTSSDAADFARAFYGDDLEIFESTFVILLNRANRTIGWAKISQGGVSSNSIDMKIICKYAIESLCSGLILVHNHPSGNTNPSRADIKTTEALRKALSMFEISLTDSIILGEEEYYSFCDDRTTKWEKPESNQVENQL